MRFVLPSALVLSVLFAACSESDPGSAPATPASGGSTDAGGAPPSEQGGQGGEEEEPPPEEEGEGGASTAAAGAAGAAGKVNTTGCASGAKSPSGIGEDMNGGRACLDCHKTKGKPDLVLAGTVYGALREPNRCAGAEPDGSAIQDAVMTITDGEGTVVDVAVRAKGNFLLTRKAHPLVPPFSATLTWEGRTVTKQIPVDSGDCNTCHTADGTDGAEGRIVLP